MSTFLEDQAKARGITVSQMMSERSKKADKSKAGFASMTPERLSEVAKRGGKAGLGKPRGKKTIS